MCKPDGMMDNMDKDKLGYISLDNQNKCPQNGIEFQ